jgi:hypothetical protein
MTELELHRWITRNNIEWRWQDNDGVKDVLVFPRLGELSSLVSRIDPQSSFFELGREVTWMGDYLCIWMRELCEYFGIEIENIFIETND